MPKALKSQPPPPGDFARRLVRWQKAHGRHGLPWQGTRDPYRVWLSEIMLQQTQVATVIPYYQRFLERFPTVAELAAAPVDEVMALWTGLGYYSRARNLHRCAQQVMAMWHGEFPICSEDLAQLSGIGPSTAAAIASICQAERVAIFDGNVQRVLARHAAFGGDLSQSGALRELKALAQAVLPAAKDMPVYTQAIMDVGATVCTPRKPDCLRCPVAADCAALAQGRVSELPVKTRKVKRMAQSWWLLLLRHDRHGVWLEQRPQTGIWAGLYGVPVFESREALWQSLPVSWRSQAIEHASVLHVLTHRDLHLHWCEVPCSGAAGWAGSGGWVAPQDWDRLGLPKPVRDRLRTAPGDV